MVKLDMDYKKLEKTLHVLPERIQKNVVKGAIRASGAMLRKEVRRLAPKDTGTLAKSINVSSRRSRDRNIIHFSVGVKKGFKRSHIARFIEFGTVKMSAKPFFRPAIGNVKDQMSQEARKYMAKRLPKELEKARNAN